MLVAVAVVNAFRTPTLHALKRAGLEYLLLDEAQAQEFRNGTREAASDAGRHKPDAEAQAIRNTVRESARQPAAPDVRPRIAPASEAARTAHDPAQDGRETVWPAVWRERLKKTRSAPVIWTYWELGADLCGAPDPKRRELLQALLQYLAHPPGTHGFWPAALPHRDEQGEHGLKANAPVFWEGVRLLQGRAVVIMGEPSLRALALPDRLLAMHPFQQVRHQGRLLIVLPAPDTLIQEDRRMQALREFLRQALTPFA